MLIPQWRGASHKSFEKDLTIIMLYKAQHLRLITAVMLGFNLSGLSPVFAQTAPFDRSVPAAASARADQTDNTSPTLIPVAAKPIAASNPYLETFLTLQRQNALLAQLLEREKSVAAMVISYKKIGIAYDAPKPDLNLCLELPKNLTCALAYPDRYADFLPPPLPTAMPVIPVIPVTVSNSDELPKDVDTLSPDFGLKDLMWTDISCLQGSCRAVITPDPSNPSARYSVKAGDALPPGGTVNRISNDGVTITANSGKLIDLPPAPTRPFAM